MTLAIVTATTTEMAAVLKGFNGRGRIGCNLPEQGNWCRSPVNGYDCLLAVTGVGPVNAALTLGRLLGTHSLSGVLCLGVAGSFDLSQAPLGSAHCICEEIYPEYGLVTSGRVDAHGISFPQLLAEKVSGEPVWERIAFSSSESCEELGLSLPSLPVATSLTVAGVTGTLERAAHLWQRYGALLENMEGFSLALGCVQAGIPFVELRTVSNRVGSRSKDDWQLDEALAALGNVARHCFV